MPAGVLKHYVVPAVALLINISMYAAPLKAVVRANREQRLGDFNPLPPLLTFVNSTTWLVFAIAARDPWVFAANDVGMILGLFFTLSCFALGSQQARRHMLGLLAVAAAAWSVMAGVCGLGALERGAVKSVWGVAGNVVAVVFYMVPLSTMVRVIRARDSASLHIPQLVLNLCNAGLWTAYGLGVGEFLVALPNIPGIACSGLALALCFVFPRRGGAAGAENSPGSPGGTGTAQPARPATPSKQSPGSPASGRMVHLVAASQASAPAWLGALPGAAGRRELAEAAGPAAAALSLAGAAEASRARHTSSELDGPPSLQYLLLPKQAGLSREEELV